MEVDQIQEVKEKNLPFGMAGSNDPEFNRSSELTKDDTTSPYRSISKDGQFGSFDPRSSDVEDVYVIDEDEELGQNGQDQADQKDEPEEEHMKDANEFIKQLQELNFKLNCVDLNQN